MKTAKRKHNMLAGFLAIVLALILGAGFPAIPVHAAGGNVYTCDVTPCYRHPVTGAIEDSGGESSYATGQGMVEGTIYPTGIMEVTEDGNYYLTIRMSLMDYTSNHSFWVQNTGDSGWSSPAMGVTANGTDSNGTTADVCIQVPSENCVVRASMYVEPMGRDVVFFLYPSNYVSGNSTDMVSTMITSATTAENSSSTQKDSSQSGGSISGSNPSLSGDSQNSENSGETGAQTNAPAGTDTQTLADTQTGADTHTQPEAETDTQPEADRTTGDTQEAPSLQSSITAPATEDTTTDIPDTTLSSARGLSLSTAGDASADETSASPVGVGQQILILVVSILIAGGILMVVGAILIYYFRKNWYRWGGGEDDE